MTAPGSMLALFGSIGNGEMLMIGLVALLLFGNRLPEVMRSLGKGVVQFKKALRDTQDEIERAADAPPTATPTKPALPGGTTPQSPDPTSTSM